MAEPRHARERGVREEGLPLRGNLVDAANHHGDDRPDEAGVVDRDGSLELRELTLLLLEDGKENGVKEKAHRDQVRVRHAEHRLSGPAESLGEFAEEYAAQQTGNQQRSGQLEQVLRFETGDEVAVTDRDRST